MKSLGELTCSITYVRWVVEVVYRGFFLAIFFACCSANAQAPQISQHPQPQTVAAGSNVIFNVIASGTPPPVYQWRFNTTNLLAGATSSSFTISNAQPIKSGNYDVVVSNSLGVITSQMATLTVSWQAVLVEAGGAGLPSTTLGTQGGTWLDYDNDGFLDLLLINYQSQNNLYHNNGNGTFSQITTGAVVTTSGGWGAVGIADYDNDGDVDLLIANNAGGNSALYRNDGGGNFITVTGAIASITANAHSVAFGDVNRDGFADVLLPQRPGSHLFFRNIAGTFQSADIGLSSQPGDANSAVWGDLNGDGWPDLFSAHQPNADCLYTNNGSGAIVRIPSGPVVDDAANTVTGAWGDYDNDGDLDLAAAYFSGGDEKLFRNDGAGQFVWVDTSVLPRLGEDTYSVAWGDYNNDGFLDLFVANAGGAPQVNHLWLNNGNGTFTSAPPGTLPHAKANSTGAVWADYDRDGNLDLLVTDVNSYNRIFRNSGSGGSWLEVKLNGQKSNRSGIGAVLRLGTIVDGGFRWQRRDIGGGGYGCANPLEAHFGLGDATNIIALRIEWPSGAVQTISNVAPRQVLTVTEAGIQLVRSSLALAAGARGAFEALPGTNQFTYQWYFGTSILVGETNRVLGFPNATVGQAGSYKLYATGGGQVTELTAQLDVVTTLETNLVAFWPFDGNATDASGHAHDGVIANVAPAPDRYGAPGYAFYFNGQSSVITVPDSTDFDFGPSDFSITFWLKYEPGFPQVGVGTVIAQSPGSGVFNKWYFWSQPEFYLGGPGVSGSVHYILGTPTNALVNGWFHTAVTRQGNLWRFYLNGDLFGETTYSGAVPDAATSLTIGSTENLMFLRGTLDNLRVYRRALSAQELLAQTASESPEWLTITQQPAGSTNVAGTNLALSVAATGVGPLSYQWRLNGVDLANSTTSTLAITNARPIHAGVYSVVVSNASGAITSQVASVVVEWQASFAAATAGVNVPGAGDSTGVAWGDFNNDRYPDFVVANSSGQNEFLFRNNTNGTFIQITNGAVVSAAGDSASPGWGDFNNDGALDLVVANTSSQNEALFTGNGSGGFSQVLADAVVTNGGFSVSSAWGDYDRDGYLDLFLANEGGNLNFLFHNNGNGTFTRNITSVVATTGGSSAGSTWVDYDNDGWLDLFVANNTVEKKAYLFHNNGDGTFDQITSGPLVQDQQDALGAAWGDYDNDGFADVFIATLPNAPNRLYHNNGDGSFSAVAGLPMVQNTGRSDSPVWLDFNNDSWLDLFVANANQRNFLYQNNGDGTWTEILTGLVATTGSGNSAAVADYNRDGNVDLLVGRAANNGNLLYLNSGSGANWLMVQPHCLGRRDGLGVRIKVLATIDGVNRWLMRDVMSSVGRNSQNFQEAHFGLSDATNISTLRIEWPSGALSQLQNVVPNQFLNITESTVTVKMALPRVLAGASFSLYPTNLPSGVWSYQWLRNGTNIVNATNAAFGIGALSTNDFGHYTLQISNATGLFTSSPFSVTNFFTWPTNMLEISAGALTSSAGFTAAIGVGDYDNDGWNDVFLSNHGDQRNMLLQNLRNGTFAVNETAPSQIPIDPQASYQASAFGDYDNDGLPDLFLAVQQTNSQPALSLLFRNLDGTNFSRVTTAGSLTTNLFERAITAAWSDLNNDGWLDLVIAYYSRNTLGVFRNNGDGTFTDLSSLLALDAGATAISVAIADFDNDGLPDLLTSAQTTTTHLYRNLGGFQFGEQSNTGLVGVPNTDTWVQWLDYDRDGNFDVWMSSYYPASGGAAGRLFRNNTNGTFSLLFQGTNANVHANMGWADFNLDGQLDEPTATVGVDLNNDGLPDSILLGYFGLNERAWTNRWNGAAWLTVKLKGGVSNRSGIGAKIRAHAIVDGQDVWQLRQISGGNGYPSAGPLEAYFGFGDATNISLLRIEWPSGKVQEFTNVAPNQFLTIQEQTIFYFGVNGSGSLSYAPVKSNYFVGETITLTATTNRYYRFVQWSDGNTNAVRSYTVGLSNVLTAVFTNVVPLESLVLKQWEASFGGTSSDYARAIRVTSDGGYILACESASGISGNKSSTNSGGNDIWVIKLDAHGSKQWERTYGGANGEGAGDVIQTPDGGYMIAGTSYSPPSGNKTSPHFGDADCWLIKVDSGGNIQWQKSYGTDGQDILNGISHTSDDTYIITSGTYSPTLPTGGNRTAPFRGASGYADAWVFKVDSAGNSVWDVSYGPPGGGGAECTVVAPDGNLWAWGNVAGSQGYLNGAGGVRTSTSLGGLSDNWLVKLSPQGGFLWEQSFGGAGSDSPSIHSLQIMSDGSGVMDGRFNVGSNEFGYVVRVGPTGNTLYERTYGGSGLDAFKTLALARDGGVYVGGESDSPAGSGTKTASAYGGLDGWIAKLDFELNKKWDYSLGGSGSNETITHIIATPDGGFAVAGRSDSTPGSGGGNKTSASYGSGDVWVVKMFEAELPLGTPVVLVNDLYSVSNSFAIPETNSIMVALQTSFTNGFLFYTLDGSFPVAYDNATTYAEPGSPGTAFTVTNSCVVTAIAYDENGNNEILGDPVFISVVPVYNLTNTTPGGGTVTMNPPGGIYWSNTVVTLTPVASNGWTFMRWEGSVTNTSNPLNLTMDSSKSIRAVFGTGVTNSSNPVGSGTVSLWPATGPYEYGSLVRLTGVPTAPNRFNRWFAGLGGPTNNPLNFTVLVANTNITANFSALTANNFTLTALLNGYGTVTRSPLANQYLSNTVVSLTAVPDPGYVFTGWSGNASGLSNPINVTLNSNKVVIANFVIAGSETNQPPSIAITNPANLATFTAPTNITINASTADSDGSVTQVVFRVGASLIGTVAAAPFNFVWTNAPVGTNSLSTIATDNGGLSTTSAPVNVVVETALPQIVLTAPTNSAGFFTPANVSMTAIASDADNTISNVTFYAGTNLLTTFTAQPYTFVWSNVAVGSYALSARVQDNYGPIVTSAPVNITVSAPPGTNPPVFRFNPGSYTVNASNGSVSLTVVNDGDLGGLVNFTTLDGTAYGGSGYSGDYTTQLGSLTFTGGQHSATITIGLRNNFLSAPDVSFLVQLFQPSAGTLGSPAVANVTIQRNDPAGATNSLTTIAVGSGQPPTSGALQVMLTPPEAGGQWRFPWDLGWRTNGATASSLETENYPIEFRNVSNYVAFPATITVAVTNGGTTPATGEYHPGLESGGAGVGSLTVNISPNAPGGSGWRLFGETSYRAPNSTATSLLPDTYFVEFAPVAGWTKPATRTVEVAAGQGTTVFDNYLLPQSLPPGAGIPGQLLHSQIVNPASFPYWFNGQLQTDVGFGSGVVVRETVVLTAAHMVFNDVTLSYVNRAWWHYQKEAGVFDPKPNEARGWYVLSGYAAQRTNDIPNPPAGAGTSSAASRNLDVAALYFTAPAARGGFGGYLASDVVPNPWLTDAAKNKMLVGYPVDGSLFGQAVQSGRMYATPLQTTALNHATNQTYTTASFIGHPGNSGGPVYVAFNGYYYPAAVYLGTLGSGVNSISTVRAINSDVVNLINLASSLGDAGTNNNGGGVITLLAPSVTAVKPAYVQVLFGPPAAVQAGAGWRLSGDATYGTATNYIRTITNTNATIEFKPLVGWNPPSISAYTVQAGALTTIPAANYTPILPSSPSFQFLPETGFGLSGTTNTKYRIEYTANLTSGLWTPLQTNTITTSGFNLVLPWPPPTNLPSAFYRAVWLP